MEEFVKFLCLPCYVDKNMAVMLHANELEMNGVMTHNANIIKKQIQTAPLKCITYPQIVRVYIRCVMFTVTWVQCDPAADNFT